MKHPRWLLAHALTVGAGLALPCSAQQMSDPDFHPNVESPVFAFWHPVVMFDEAHHNFHKASGNYKPFVQLMVADGHCLFSNHQPFSCCSLAGCHVLVISNALGDTAMDSPRATEPAFTEFECDQVAAWVARGGGLLLIADHPPFGAAAHRLAKRFGVHMSNALTIDEAHCDADGPSSLVYSRENGLLGDHPVTRGRNDGERVNRVITFTGQSIQGPSGSVNLLKLSDAAKDIVERDSQVVESFAQGRSQGVALVHGCGRVVVLGEAGMLTAQIYRNESGAVESWFGMNRADFDNRQFALNIMRWLAKATR